MKYTLDCLFWEIRAIVSTFLVILFFCHIRLVDSFLKHFLEFILTKKIELRVEIEDLILDVFQGTCDIKGIIIYHPTIEEDPRWHYEYLAYAKSISMKFDTFQSIYAFCYGHCSLLYLEEVVVSVIDLYVEGYEGKISQGDEHIMTEGKEINEASRTKKVINLELLGGERPARRKRKKPTAHLDRTPESTEAVHHHTTGNIDNDTSSSLNIVVGKLVPDEGNLNSLLDNNHSGGSNHHGEYLQHTQIQNQAASCEDQYNEETVSQSTSSRVLTSHSDLSTAISSNSGPHSSSVNVNKATIEAVTGHISESASTPSVMAVPATTRRRSRKKSWSRSALSLGKQLTSKIHSLNKEVQEEGLLATVKTKTVQAIAATVSTVDQVYKHAKKTIGSSYHSKINRLHEKLRGGEPIPLFDDLFVQIKSIKLLDIEITLYQTLPPSLRQLEKKALHVPAITLTDVRKGWLPPSSKKDTSHTSVSTSHVDTEPTNHSAYSSSVTDSSSTNRLSQDYPSRTLLNREIFTDEDVSTGVRETKLHQHNSNHDEMCGSSSSDVDEHCLFRDVEGVVDSDDSHYCDEENENWDEPTHEEVDVIATEYEERSVADKNDHDSDVSVLNMNLSEMLGMGMQHVYQCMQSRATLMQEFVKNKILAETFDGIPAIVVAYYFERILLHEILKDNAGKSVNEYVLWTNRS
mmetsp:Transcript_10129/g.18925  ORF Transcript_10129/g.18925 Transcript_10129/m.18925 type:complete len:690 (-) Transcript_10129:547-2616(-)